VEGNILLNSIQFALTQIRNPHKHILEFGVYQGASISTIRNVLDSSYQVFGFDSFEGLPENWEGTVCNQGAFSTYGNIPNVPGVTFFKGWFEDTIKDYLKIQQPITLLHLDCDLYSSTKTVLDNIGHLLVKDTVICCDEWIYCSKEGMKDDHEQRAFLEWTRTNNRGFEFFDFVDHTVNGHERKVLKIL